MDLDLLTCWYFLLMFCFGNLCVFMLLFDFQSLTVASTAEQFSPICNALEVMFEY
jgi:hypothetical protein